MQKLEWLGYPKVKNVQEIQLLVLTEFTNVTDGQTDRQTDACTTHDDIGCAYA